MEAHLMFCLKVLNNDKFVKAAFLVRQDSFLNLMGINGRPIRFILSTISPKENLLRPFRSGFSAKNQQTLQAELLVRLNQNSSWVGGVTKLACLVYSKACFHDSKAKLRIYF